jgi:hypothetical protein
VYVPYPKYTISMKLFQILSALIAVLTYSPLQAQTQSTSHEFEQISATLMDYIEGTANGEPERLRKAFHPDFNLYTVTRDSLWIRSGEKYISNIKPGEKANRIGRIISIDYEKDAAMAKAEIVIPGWRIFTDYFLLLKYEGSWKIVQKSYTWREYPVSEEKK